MVVQTIGSHPDSTTQNLRPPELRGPRPEDALETQDTEAKERQAMVAWTARILIAVSLLFGLQAVVLAGPLHPRTLTFVVTIPIATLLPALSRRMGAQIPALILCSLIVLHVASAQYLQGSFRPSSQAWLVVAAVLATIMAGPRVGIVVTLLGGLTVLALFVAFSYGYPAVANPGIHETPVQSTMSLLAALGVVTGVVMRHERRRKEAQYDLRRALLALRSANTELQGAREAAEAASEAKTQFVAGVSHELRTPLNGVMGMTDLLLSSDLRGDQREYAETIDGSTRSLVTLIDELLDFSKLDIGKLTLDSGSFDVEELLEESVSLLASDAHRKGLELSACLEAGVPADVIGDAGRLRQVLLNLISNAVKFTKTGEVSVLGRLEGLEAGIGTFRFEVRDTGIGIHPKERHQIFDAFYQGDHRSLGELVSGTGLGLAISRRLVELMGGAVHVRSVPNEGSCFEFTVLLGVVEAPSQSSPDVSQTLSGLRTLLVQWPRRPWALACLQRQLARDGVFPVVSAGPDALAKELTESKAPFRLVLLAGGGIPDPSTVALMAASQTAADGRRPAVVVLRPPRGGRPPSSGESSVVWLVRPTRRSTLLAGITRALTGEASRRDETDIVDTEQSISMGRVLVAEDDETNQRTAQLMLEHLGYQVTIVTQGEDVLSACDHQRFDLILMDGRMPGMSGYETAQTVRRRTREDRHTPIVGMTAHAGLQERRRCLDAGMNDYLPKPVGLGSLQAMLEKWIYARTSDANTTPSRARFATGVDLGVLDSLFELVKHPELVVELIDVFLRDAPVTLKRVRGAHADSDAPDLVDSAHKLKGAAGNLGAHGLAALALRLETRARDGRLAGMEAELGALAEEFEKVREILRRKREELTLPQKIR